MSRPFVRFVALAASVLAIGASLAFAAPADAATIGTYTYYPVAPADDFGGIASGPDGNLWFTDSTGDSIDKITPAGVVTKYTVPTADASPSGITVGPDGRLWFTEFHGDKIGAITTAGVFSEYPITAGSGSVGIVTGPDGNLWITEEDRSEIATMSPAGVLLNEAPITGDSPYNIIVGSDGKLWFTEYDSSLIGTISTSYVIHEYTTPFNTAFIALASNGDVWFTSHFTNPSGASVTPSGFVTPLPGLADVADIVAGPNGNIWGHNNAGGGLDEFTTAGTSVAHFPDLSVHGANLTSIVEGPDHNLWFTTNDGFIGVLRLTTKPVLASTGVGPEFWIAGGIASVVVIVGLGMVLTGRLRRRRPAHLA